MINIIVFSLILHLVSGTWPAIVTIESVSMTPGMNPGDLVLVMADDRISPLQTMEDATLSGYEMFGSPGDVIIYYPNGNRTLLPIIHRALKRVNEGPTDISYRVYNNSTGYYEIKRYISPNNGYITKGDNNHAIDQIGFGDDYRGLGSPLLPVKEEWIIGKAVYKIPSAGILPDPLFWLAVIL